MANEAYWKECAIEIAKGVCEFVGMKYIPENYVPAKAVTPESSKEDIRWAQERLNTVLPNIYPAIPGIVPLQVDGDYGPKTRIAVLMYWDALGWGRHMNDDGRKVGKSTIEALAAGRTK